MEAVVFFRGKALQLNRGAFPQPQDRHRGISSGSLGSLGRLAAFVQECGSQPCQKPVMLDVVEVGFRNVPSVEVTGGVHLL